MSRTAATFKQVDLARALRAVQASGMTMAVVLRPDGKIMLLPCDGPVLATTLTTPEPIEESEEFVL